MRQHCLTFEGQTRQEGMTCSRHRQRTPARGEGGSRIGSGPLPPASLSPFSGFPCSSSSPSGKGNPLLLLFPGARWELNVAFRFLYCGLTLPHIKNSSHGHPATVLLEGSQQLYLVSCAKPTRSLQTPSWVPTPLPGQKRVPVSLLLQPGIFLATLFQTLGDSDSCGQVLAVPPLVLA